MEKAPLDGHKTAEQSQRQHGGKAYYNNSYRNNKSNKNFQGKKTMYIPWIKRKMFPFYDEKKTLIEKLDQEIRDFVEYISPTEAERRMRDFVVSKLKNLVAKIWPNASVNIYGSFPLDLYLPMSDIDVVINGGREYTDGPIYKFAEELEKCSFYRDMNFISTAKIPIIKISEQFSGCNVDITFDHPCNAEQLEVLVKKYASEFPEFRPLLLILKYFLYQRALNIPFQGGLGSFALMVLVRHFLHTYLGERGFGPSFQQEAPASNMTTQSQTQNSPNKNQTSVEHKSNPLLSKKTNETHPRISSNGIQAAQTYITYQSQEISNEEVHQDALNDSKKKKKKKKKKAKSTAVVEEEKIGNRQHQNNLNGVPPEAAFKPNGKHPLNYSKEEVQFRDSFECLMTFFSFTKTNVDQSFLQKPQKAEDVESPRKKLSKSSSTNSSPISNNRKRKVIKRPNLGELLVNFFKYFGEFNFVVNGISVDAVFSKEEKGLVDVQTPWKLFVEDPISPSNNLGSSTYRILTIKDLFKSCYLALIDENATSHTLLTRIIFLNPMMDKFRESLRYYFDPNPNVHPNGHFNGYSNSQHKFFGNHNNRNPPRNFSQNSVNGTSHSHQQHQPQQNFGSPPFSSFSHSSSSSDASNLNGQQTNAQSPPKDNSLLPNQQGKLYSAKNL